SRLTASKSRSTVSTGPLRRTVPPNYDTLCDSWPEVSGLRAGAKQRHSPQNDKRNGNARRGGIHESEHVCSNIFLERQSCQDGGQDSRARGSGIRTARVKTGDNRHKKRNGHETEEEGQQIE